jgi:hypothetical protein
VTVQLYLKKTLSGFEPADDHARALHRRYKLGETYRAEIVKPRSYRHHCLCLALLNLTFDNQDRYEDFDSFRKAVAIAAGHVDELITLQGEVLHVPKSISYDAIPDDVTFGRVMSKMMDICSGILGNMDRYELQAEVSKYAMDHYGVAA